MDICPKCGNNQFLEPSGLCSPCDILSNQKECPECGKLRLITSSGYCSKCSIEFNLNKCYKCKQHIARIGGVCEYCMNQ